MARRRTTFKVRHRVGRQYNDRMRNHQAVFGSGSDLYEPMMALFSAGEPGLFIDPADISTMFQDSAGTSPVGEVGHPVGRILDKSGRNNHAYQITAAARPTLQRDSEGRWYLLFDGVDDVLITDAVDFTGTNKSTIFAGVRKLNNSFNTVIAALNGVFPAANYFAMTSTGNTFGAFSKGSGSSNRVSTAAYAAPVSAVVTTRGNIATDLNTIRVNTTDDLSIATDQGTGNYGNAPIVMGHFPGVPISFLGANIYAVAVRGAETDLDTIVAIEALLKRRIGVP